MLKRSPATFAESPRKMSPHLNRICRPLCECPSAAAKSTWFSTLASAGHPPLPATGVPDEETQVVAGPGKPFGPDGSYAVTASWQLAVFVPSVALTVAV